MHRAGYRVPQGAAGMVIIAWYRAVPITQKMPLCSLARGRQAGYHNLGKQRNILS